MMRWLRRLRYRRAAPDPEAFRADLEAAMAGVRYRPIERYRDFRAVFMATPPGRRVLWQILDWAHLWQHVAIPGDPHGTYLRDGRRDIGLKILKVMGAEPAAEAGQRAQSKE